MEYHYSIEIRNTSLQAIKSEIERRNSDLPFESMWRFKRTAFIGSFDNNIRVKSSFTDYYIISNKTPSLHTYLAELGFTCETSVLSTYLEPGLTLTLLPLII